ncbi:MAG: signal peptidase I [Planctomycetota bacterium]|jgi:signal peptidase I
MNSETGSSPAADTSDHSLETWRSGSDVAHAIPQANREPWLAGSLSWVLPGLGQIYAARVGRGVSLIILAGFLHVFAIASLISTRTLVLLPIVLNLCGIIAVPIYASLDAYRLAKRRNSKSLERERTLGKDPWLAVFLTVVLPGLGHIYLRKRIVGVLLLLSFCVLRVKAQTSYYALFAVMVIPAIASAHVYAGWRFHKIQLKSPFTLFVILLLSSGLLKNLLVPQVESRFFVQGYVITGTSMEPTILHGSRLVVDRFTYHWMDPAIGDIVELIPPETGSSDLANCAFKRIVAAGGETIQVRDSDVYVNGRKREAKDRAPGQGRPGSLLPIDFFETDNRYLAYGVDEPYRVPEGHYFVLGDNDAYSVDSRCFGAVPRENIKGKVIKIAWPPGRIGVLK